MYPTEVLKRARDEYNKRKEQFTAKNQNSITSIFQTLPQVKTLSEEISRTSAMLAINIINGTEVTKNVEKIKDYNISKNSELKALLVNKGFSPDALSPKYYCPLCCDRGIYNGKTCKCITDIQKEIMYERLGSGENLDSYSFDDIRLSYYEEQKAHMEKSISKCVEFAESFSKDSKSMIFSGGVGLGKTHISKAIGKIVIDKGFDVFYIPFTTLSTRLESAKFGRSEGNYQQYLDPVIDCDLLILDDLGAEFSTTFTTALLYEIINTRLLKKLPTIINTNLDYNALGDRYGERILSRLANCFSFILFMGKDIRMKKKFSLN